MTGRPSDQSYKVAIVVVTCDAYDFARICLESVEKYSTMPHEIIVVDNCSGEPLRSYLKQKAGVSVIFNDENRLWCEGCNQGIREVRDATHVLLLNSDTEVRRADWLQRMVNVAQSSARIGIVGTAADRVRIWPTFGGADGQCMLIKKQLIDEIGLLDSERLPWNGADIDYAARAFKKGYIYKIMPAVPELVAHYHGMSWRTGQVGIERLQQDLDISRIMTDAGLRPLKMPKFLWEMYKLLPGRPFFELTYRERKSARGGQPVKRKRYGQKFRVDPS